MSLPINFFLIFIARYLLSSIVLVSAIHRHESATRIHPSPPSWISLPSPTPSHLSRLSQSPGLTSLCLTANSHRLPVLHMVMWMFPRCSLNSPPLPPALCPQVRSLCWHLHCYPASRLISTVFHSITCLNIQYLSFSFWLTQYNRPQVHPPH